MAARDDILRSIRLKKIPAAPLPDLQGPWITYPDRERQFGEALQFVGGRMVAVSSIAQAQADLAKFEPYAQARQVYSAVTGLGKSNVNLQLQEDPHQAQDLDYVILTGEFAVVENGAVWVTDKTVKQRVAYFITQHLALVVPRKELVDNMLQAYDRIKFAGPGFGVFISGPSKTADIEQSLVIGAHGARSLTVYLVG